MSTSSTMADSGSKLQDSDKKRRREKIVRLTLEILESEKDYQVLNILGCGTYGDVFQIYDSKRDIEIAAKIVTSDNISEMELSLWPKLNHPNIVPLMELFTLNLLDVAIFIMPLQYKTLHDLLFDTRFSKSRNSSLYLKRWFFEILCAISYMHEQDMCHLDIKVDNVLITHTFSAMLCDFSFLNDATKPLERYDLGLPYIYRPPEACLSLGKSISLNGIAYDMWGYGIMVVEIFTHLSLAVTIMDCKCWLKEVYPILFDILQEKKFTTVLLQTLPGISAKECEPTLALNFIHMFLKVDPFQRSSAQVAKQHVFLGSGSITSEADEIWKEKVEEIVIVNRRDDDDGSDKPECSYMRNSEEDFDYEHNSSDGHLDISLKMENYCTEVFEQKASIGTEVSKLFDSVEIATNYRTAVSNFQSIPTEESSKKISTNVDICLHNKPKGESYQSNGMKGYGNDESANSCILSKSQQQLKTSSNIIEIVSPEQPKSGNPMNDPHLSSKTIEAKNNNSLPFLNENKILKRSQNIRKQKLKRVKAKKIPKYKRRVKKLTKSNYVTRNKKNSKLDTQSNKCHVESLDLYDEKMTLTEESSTCTEENTQEISAVIPTNILFNETEAVSDEKRYCETACDLKFYHENFPENGVHFSQLQKSLSAEFDLTSRIEIKGATGDFQQPQLPSSGKGKEIDFSTDVICRDNFLLEGFSTKGKVNGDKTNSLEKNKNSTNEFEKYIKNLRLQVNQLDEMVRELEKNAVCKKCSKSRHQTQHSRSGQSSVSAETNLQTGNSSNSEDNPTPGYKLLGNISVSNNVNFPNNLSSNSKQQHTSREAFFEETSITATECSQSDHSYESLDNFAFTNAGCRESSVSIEEYPQNHISSQSTEESKSGQICTEDVPNSSEEQPHTRVLLKLTDNLASERVVSEETYSTDEGQHHQASVDSLISKEEFSSRNWSNSFEEKDLMLGGMKLRTKSMDSNSCFMNGKTNQEYQTIQPNINHIYSRNKRFMKWLRKKFLELERILKHREYHLMT